MADLEQWQPAVPDRQQLVAAAPMFGEWRGPAMTGWRAFLPGSVAALTFPLVSLGADNPLSRWWGALGLLLASVAGSVIWRRWWRKRHPRPTGMAAVLDWKWARGPVLLVTGSSVLQTGLLNGTTGRARPSAPAKDIPGLVAVDAVEERLVLTFEDGSEAWLRQRWPTPGAAGRVAELAAPVLRRRQPDGRQAASSR